jgi:CRP-like cAMP-binding protein
MIVYRQMKARGMARNRILDLFEPETTNLQKVTYARGEFIGAAGEPIENVLFPGSGLISVVVDLATGDQVEAGMVGREGAVGAIAIFGGKKHANNSICLVNGIGWMIALPELVRITHRYPLVRSALLNYEQFLLVQARQTAACNAKHSVSNRLARWLLQAHHATGQTDLEATQESIAGMLGVQRPAISVCANQFKAEGLIGYRRGRIILLDMAGLKREACECYDALQQQYDYLLGGLTSVAAE